MMNFEPILYGPLFIRDAQDINLVAASADPVDLTVSVGGSSWTIPVTPVLTNNRYLAALRMREILSSVVGIPGLANAGEREVPLVTLYAGDATMSVRAVYGAASGKTPTQLAGHWLSWRDQVSMTHAWGRERLTFLAGLDLLGWQSGTYSVKAKIFLSSGDPVTVTLTSGTLQSGCRYVTVDASYATIAAAVSASVRSKIRAWDVSYSFSGTDSQRAAATINGYPLRLIIARDEVRVKEFVFCNSFGVEDRVYSSGRSNPKLDGSSVAFLSGATEYELRNDSTEGREVYSGRLGSARESALWLDFLKAHDRYILASGGLARIIVDSQETDLQDNALGSVKFTYHLGALDNGRYFNDQEGLGDYDPTQRHGALYIGDEPPSEELPSEDLFFLKTRLDEFPVADLSEEYLFLVQDPLTLEWCNAPLSDIKEWLQQVITHEDVHVWSGPWEDYSAGVSGYALAASLGKDLCDRIEALEDAPAYQLPIATATRLGGIKVGSGLAITQDGVLSAGDYFEQDPDYSGEAHLKSAYAGLRIPGLRFGAGREAFDLEVRNVAAEGETPVYVLYSPLPLVTGGDQIVIGGEPGGGGGGGVMYLSELLDVSLANLAGGQVLSYDSTAQAWKNRTLGAAADYGVTNVVTAGDTTHLVTGAAVATAVAAVLKWKGITTTDIAANPSANPIIINGQSYTAVMGDVVVLSGTSTEYLYNGSTWEPMGDEASYALKTVTITGTGYLTGGGTLEANRTLDIASSVKTKIDNGAAAYGYFTNGVLGTSHLPALYIGDAQVQTSAQTAQNIGGLGNLTLYRAKSISFMTTPGTGETSQAVSVLGFSSSNNINIGHGAAANGSNTYVNGKVLYLRYGTSRTTGLKISGDDGEVGITAYLDVIPSANNSKSIGSASAMWKYIYTNRLYLTPSVYLQYVDNSGNGYVHINAPLVTDGDQIVVSGTPGGGGSGGVNWLYELQDVDPALLHPTGGYVLQYDATLGKWTGAAPDTIGITTAGTVAELNAANPSTAKRVWSPSVLASWLAGKGFLTSAVTNVAVGGSGHTDELAITKNGSTSYLTVPYALNAPRFKRYDGTLGVQGGYDLNTLLSGGGITSQYNSMYTWGNGPTGMSFGGAVQLNPNVNQSLAMQLAWDIDHTNVKTGKLWWRDSIYKNSTHTWGGWHLIYDDANLTANAVVGILGTTPVNRATADGSGNTITSTYLKLSGGTMTGDIKMTNGEYIISESGLSMLGINAAGTTFYCGPGYEISSAFLLRSGNINLVHRKFTAANTYTDHAIWDSANTTISNAALILGSASLGTSSTPIGYATQVRRPWAVEGTQEAGGFDLNTALAGGGAIRNVNSSTYWAHAPEGATYFGMAWQLKPSDAEAGSMQFFWDGDYRSTTAPTGRLFWRLRNSVGWADDWHRIYDSANANLSTIDWNCKDLNAAGKVNVGAPSFSDGALNVNGAIVSAGDQIIASDERIKRNFKAIELSVDQIASCRAVSFDWAAGGHSFGSVAQDWEPLVPEAVKQGDIKTLAYGQLALVAAINIAKHDTERDKEIRRLRKRVKNLEEEVKRLKA